MARGVMPMRSGSARSRRGFTLIEVLTATALTLMLMAAVVTIFGSIGGSISDSRATLEISDRLRGAETRLLMDLNGFTVTPIPPRDPAAGEGYLEIIEGPRIVASMLAPRLPNDGMAVDTDPGTLSDVDMTVGDNDDILMLTVHSKGQPFVGRYRGGTIESHLAEICWFVRGRTLYRRVLLIVPGIDISGASAGGFYQNNDISVRVELDPASGGQWLVANSLSDLTRRECRFAHDVRTFPFDARGWGQLGLPTLRECSSPNWAAGAMPPIWKYEDQIDFWNNPHPWNNVDPDTGTLEDYMGPRLAEDVILTDVIGFDVKVWDPLAKMYVDMGGPNAERFRANAIDVRSGYDGTGALVYCTWSKHYDSDGVDQFEDGMIDTAGNGFDDNTVAGVDDSLERETQAPYAVPLRGIQVKIRVFEPDTRQIREVTVAGDFLPK